MIAQRSISNLLHSSIITKFWNSYVRRACLRSPVHILAFGFFSLASTHCQSAETNIRTYDKPAGKALGAETLPDEGLAQPFKVGQAIDWQTLRPGIDYIYLKNQFRSHVHIIRVDLTKSQISIGVSNETDKRLTTLDHSKSSNAFIAVNASFFDGFYNPRGHTVSSSTPWKKVLFPESSPFMYCDASKDCTINHKGTEKADESWHTAVGGKYSLVSAGQIRTPREDKNCGSFCTSLHPRTAIGLDRNRSSLIILMAEGRREDIRGLSLTQTANLIHYAGSYDAFNLDGGGSSSLILDGHIASLRPTAEPDLRAVASSLLIKYDAE